MAVLLGRTRRQSCIVPPIFRSATIVVSTTNVCCLGPMQPQLRGRRQAPSSRDSCDEWLPCGLDSDSKAGVERQWRARRGLPAIERGGSRPTYASQICGGGR
jgi:hypothetical protein